MSTTPIPKSWTKCSFFTVKHNLETGEPYAEQKDGWTDGVFNYYVTYGKKWYAVVPEYGMSVTLQHTRAQTQKCALELWDKVQNTINSSSNEHREKMQHCKTLITEASRKTWSFNPIK